MHTRRPGSRPADLDNPLPGCLLLSICSKQSLKVIGEERERHPAGPALGRHPPCPHRCGVGRVAPTGFAGATARAISAQAGCNQGLVFYHFGSVVNLLLAALDEVSAQRRERLRGGPGRGRAAQRAGRAGDADLQRGPRHRRRRGAGGDDRRGPSTPGLGAEVKSRVAPWTEFAPSPRQGARRPSPLGPTVDRRARPRRRGALPRARAVVPPRRGSRGAPWRSSTGPANSPPWPTRCRTDSTSATWKEDQ